MLSMMNYYMKIYDNNNDKNFYLFVLGSVDRV